MDERMNRRAFLKTTSSLYDPNGKFRNEYMQYYLYGSEELTLDDMW